MTTFLKIFRLFFSPVGRIRRLAYWGLAVFAAAVFLLSLPFMESLLGRWGTALFYVPLYWVAICLMTKRCHDIGRSAWWLIIVPIPILGIIWAVFVLGFRRGDPGTNQYGQDPRPEPPPYTQVKAVQ